jgi:hypothetical protein
MTRWKISVPLDISALLEHLSIDSFDSWMWESICRTLLSVPKKPDVIILDVVLTITA